MRTTLTLDDDVATQLLVLQRQQNVAFKVVVNAALRAGLVHLAKVSEPRARYAIKPVSLGAPQLPSLDNIADVLATAEGDHAR